MKKSPRPFTFEVKRSRLASRTPPTFQRYVVAPVSAEVQREQEAFRSQERPSKRSLPVRSGGRILPSLLGEKVWVEQPVRRHPRLLSRSRHARRWTSLRSSHLRSNPRWLNGPPIRPMRSRAGLNGPGALRDPLTICRGASAGSDACRGWPGKSRNQHLGSDGIRAPNQQEMQHPSPGTRERLSLARVSAGQRPMPSGHWLSAASTRG